MSVMDPERDECTAAKLREAVRTMVTLPAPPRHRLMMATIMNLTYLEEADFPEGELRQAFRGVVRRLRCAAPADMGRAEASPSSSLPDDDVRWIIDQVLSLAFAMSTQAAAIAAGNGGRAKPQ